MIGIYKITNTKNGKVYIGQSVDIDKRFREHRKMLRDNNHINYRLQDDWNVYGEDSFTFEVLEKCRSVYLNEIEKHTIKEYESTNEEKGYNLSAGNGRDLSAPPWYKQMGVQRYGSKYAIDYSFFRNDVGEIEYNQCCVGCKHDCKQSFRADVLICPSLESQ